jgi:hypothetical protein
MFLNFRLYDYFWVIPLLFFETKLLPHKPQHLSILVHSTHTYPLMKMEETVFRNIGIQNSDAGELPKRNHTTFWTRRKFEIKNNFRLLLKHRVMTGTILTLSYGPLILCSGSRYWISPRRPLKSLRVLDNKRLYLVNRRWWNNEIIWIFSE